MKFRSIFPILLISISLLTKTNDFWYKPTIEKFSYIYAPGFLSTESSMIKYCPSFTSWTGEKFKSKSGGYILGQPHNAVIFSEFLMNPNAKSIFDYKLNLSQTDLGQCKDIQCVYDAYQKHLNIYKDSNIIIHGHSRGAVAAFNFIAQYKPDSIKAAILEGIFDDMQHNIKHFAPSGGNFFEMMLNRTLKFLIGSYDVKGFTAKDYCKKISADIPLLFVTSLKDTVACPQGVLNLYIDLRLRGFKKVHLLVLDNACHSSYMTNNQKDKEKYENCVHSFYKYYNFPYNPNMAKLGEKVFLETQPEIVELIKYNLSTCKYCLGAFDPKIR